MFPLAITHEGFDLGPGAIVGKYRIERALTTTPSSTTYLVSHLLLGYCAVLKVPRHAEDAAREAHALSVVQNPHVPALLEIGTFRDGTRSLAYLVEEHVTGQTLSRWMATYRRLDALRTVRIALKVASALAALHRAGIVHGDVKPDNIIVDPMLESERVALIDLGASRRMMADLSGASGARLMATPAYSAPELRAGRQPTPASDVYALALVMYDALSGGNISRIGDEGVIPPLCRVVPMCERLSALIERALASDEGARFVDAAALAHELSSLDATELARFPGSSMSLSPVYQDALDTLDISRPTETSIQEAMTDRPRQFEPPALWSTDRPSIWFLGGDAATDHYPVRNMLLSLREHFEVRLLSAEGCDKARLDIFSGAPAPWVLVFGENHLQRREPLLDVLSEQGETMNLLLTEREGFDQLVDACRSVNLDATVSLDVGMELIEAEIAGAVQRAARVRRCYDSLRLALGDSREDLDGLRRSLGPLKPMRPLVRGEIQ
jgi:serine/threonine protein kinase